MAWWQFRLTTGVAALEAREAALFAAGALSISLLDAEDQPILEPGPGEMPLWDRLVVVGLFDGGQSADALAAALSESLGEPVEVPQLERLEDQAWERSWMADFKPMHFGGRLWVVPSHCEPPDPAACNLRLDPGLAFGTGTHPTTAQCLRWLADHEPAGARVLDVGCGSGVLAIAALLLGAAHATGTDIDAQALTASHDNALANGVAERLVLSLPEEQRGADFDLVLANILFEPLCTLRDAIVGAARPGAPVVLSGILVEQGPPLAEHYREHLDDIALGRDGDWAILTGRRRQL